MKTIIPILILCLLLGGCAAPSPAVEQTPPPAETPAQTPTPTPAPTPTPIPVVAPTAEYGYNELIFDMAELMGRYGERVYLHVAAWSGGGRAIPCFELGDSPEMLILCTPGCENRLMLSLEELLSDGGELSACIVPMPSPDGVWESSLDEFTASRGFTSTVWFTADSTLENAE